MTQLTKMRNFAKFVSKRLDNQALLDCRTSKAERWSEGADEWANLERELFHLLGWFGFVVEIKPTISFLTREGKTLPDTNN